jgi:hypothetical protein
MQLHSTQTRFKNNLRDFFNRGIGKHANSVNLAPAMLYHCPDLPWRHITGRGLHTDKS